MVACSVSLVVSFVAIILTMVSNMRLGYTASECFKYFTILSNMLTALASSFIIPFAIIGIRKKRFVIPKWLSMMHYSGAICITIVFVFALFIILPHHRQGAIGGSNFFLHVVCPLAVLISFFLVESGYTYSRKEILICLIPFAMYSIVYLVMVVFIGEENGGWEDLYQLTTYLPAYISFVLLWALGLAVAFAIRKVSNLLYGYRRGKMMASWKDEADPVEVKIEIYGLGRYYGLHGDKNSLSVPYDILEDASKRFDIKIDELYDAYVKGLHNGIKDKTKGE